MALDHIALTNDDCQRCAKSHQERTGESDFEEWMWVCDEGHHINGQMDASKKGCGLPEGSFYGLESPPKYIVRKVG